MKKRLITSIIFIFLLSSLFAYDWSGRYLWVNSTKKDNGGKMKSVEMVVKETEDEWKREIYLVDDGEEFRLFPLVLPTDESFSAWHKYKEDSVEAETFRHNNKKINTSSFNPGKWMIEEIKSSDSESVTLVKVGAFNIKVGVTITFSFSLDEKGKEFLRYGVIAEIEVLQMDALAGSADGRKEVGKLFASGLEHHEAVVGREAYVVRVFQKVHDVRIAAYGLSAPGVHGGPCGYGYQKACQ